MNSFARPSAAGLVATLSDEEVRQLYYYWEGFARPEQLPPKGNWTTWLLMGGRGAGKTRAGAEWIRSLADAGTSPIALVGETMTEAMAVMVKGESGIIRVTPEAERPRISGNVLRWPNGVVAEVLSATDPERFRGPQYAAAWCDEIGKWPDAEAAWDMLQFGLRLGDWPRQLATTTPRPTRLIKRLLTEPGTITTRMPTADNAGNLAPGFLETIVGRYRGSVLGRQELDGELIEDDPGALWRRDMFQRWQGGDIDRIVVAVDPPVTGHARSDACGIIVAGQTGERAVVLEDATLKAASPLAWARRAVAAFDSHRADVLIAEVNQGGDLVKSVIAQVDETVPVIAVRAKRGKWLRAEPVAALYGRGLISHAAGLTALEDEMCALGIDNRSNGHSPDRVDALVWALSELLLSGAQPRLRRI
ncbi:large terminase [Devosia pacifica]|uniref:Large terminase n=1 Tax=Devosia pacifica TaxID=1335967 RepID=A0A918S7W4_9HYPH|nr:terminase family protein [Devosia pacifica]GHA29388.1 large terminase [Devosia pacifica]